MCTYVYLNYYANGNLYVGSHTWCGDGLDPNYFGSSKVANYFHWKPIKVEVLCYSDDKLHDESKLIMKYCEMHGIACCAKKMAHASGNTWVDNFKDGLMLNCHANTMDAARSALTKDIYSANAKCLLKEESRELAIKSRYSNAAWIKLSNGVEGHYDSVSELSGINACTVRAAVSAFRRQGFYKFSSGLEIVYVKESHNGLIREYHRIYRAEYNSARKVQDSTGWIGCAMELKDRLGVSRAIAYNIIKQSYCLNGFSYGGIQFQPVEEVVDVPIVSLTDGQSKRSESNRLKALSSAKVPGRRVLLSTGENVDNVGLLALLKTSRKHANMLISLAYRNDFFRTASGLMGVPYPKFTEFDFTKIPIRRKAKKYSKSSGIKRVCSEEQLSALNRGRLCDKPYNIIAAKLRSSKKGLVTKPHLVNLYYGDNLILSGSTTECCRFIGNKNWAISVNKKFSQGIKEVFHHGYKFILID